LNDNNEREFRSFFDKIIQLPFSMPVASYKIESFIVAALKDIDFITDDEAKEKDKMEQYSEIAELAVGTNPRSLKRLTNILSLITLLQDKNQNEDCYFENEKVINFALVGLQIGYPQIYNYLTLEPNFKEWHKTLKKRLNLDDIRLEVLDKIKNTEEFDEEWEQFLYVLCEKNFYLRGKVFQISILLNKIASLIPKDVGIGTIISEVIKLSAITNLQAGDRLPEKPAGFNQAEWLHKLNEKLLPTLNKMVADEFRPVTVPQKRVQSNCNYHFGNKGGQGAISLGTINDQYIVGWWAGDWLFWGCKSKSFEKELDEKGISLETFNQIILELQSLKDKYGALKYDRRFSFRSRMEGKPGFEQTYYYCFGFPSLNEIVSDETVTKMASFIIEFIKIRFKMLELLQGNK